MAEAVLPEKQVEQASSSNGIGLGDWRGGLVPVVLIVLAEIAMIGSRYESDSVAAPSEIVVAAYHAFADGSMFIWTFQTLTSALGGLAIGGVIGLTLGIVFGLSSITDRLMLVTIESLRPIPSIALVPVVLLIFGFGYRMEIFLIVSGATFPILIFTRSAVAGTEPRLIDLSRVLGFNYFAHVWKIIIPAALPNIFVGFRLSAALALVIGVTIEVAANPQGLGSAIMVAQESLQAELMYAVLIWLGFVGWGLNAVLLWVQHRLFGPVAVGSFEV